MASYLFRQLFSADRRYLRPLWCLLCMPAIAVPLVIGIVDNDLKTAVLAAAGAFSVGLGSFHQLGHSRFAPMFFAALGMFMSSWVGTVAGRAGVATIIATGAAAYIYGIVSLKSPGESWVALTCAIWLVISTGFPATGLHSVALGLLVLTGGLLQIIFLFVFWKVAGSLGPAHSISDVAEPMPRYFLTALRPGTPQRLFAIRATVTLIGAAAIAQWTSWPNGYWIPMTALIVIRPDIQQTTHKGIARVLGTMVGAAVATLITKIASPTPFVSEILVLIFAYTCYCVLWVNYAVFAMSLTAYVVFLLSLAGLDQTSVILHRLTFTILGGVVSFIGHASFRRRIALTGATPR
jgi:hypothetical protein